MHFEDVVERTVVVPHYYLYILSLSTMLLWIHKTSVLLQGRWHSVLDWSEIKMILSTLAVIANPNILNFRKIVHLHHTPVFQ